MNRRREFLVFFWTILGFLGGTGLAAGGQPQSSEQWESEVRALEAAAQPATDGIVFIGSSSIRLWDLAKYFPELSATNRGFGGSEMADLVTYADRLVLPLRPRCIVVYAGDNDLANGKSPREIHADFCAFVKKIHAAMPAARIVYISIKPSPLRWKLFPKARTANQLICQSCACDPRLSFVNVADAMLGPDSQPIARLYALDQLHLSPKGYELWSQLVRPHLGR